VPRAGLSRLKKATAPPTMSPGSAIKAIKDNAASNQRAWVRFRSLFSLFARYAAAAAAASDLFVGVINPASAFGSVLWFSHPQNTNRLCRVANSRFVLGMSRKSDSGNRGSNRICSRKRGSLSSATSKATQGSHTAESDVGALPFGVCVWYLSFKFRCRKMGPCRSPRSMIFASASVGWLTCLPWRQWRPAVIDQSRRPWSERLTPT
jgi:hypothetical protein